MDILGSLVGSAKQLAQNAIIEKLEAKGAGADHPLLNMLHDAFNELPPEHRRQLFEAFSRLFISYKAQPNFNFEALWKEIVSEPAIQEVATRMGRKLVSNLIRKDN